MKKFASFLIFGLLFSSLYSIDSEIAVQDQSLFTDSIQEETNKEHSQSFVDQSAAREHPLLDKIEELMPENALKKYIIIFIGGLKDFKNKYKKLKESVICYQNKNDEQITQFRHEIDLLKQQNQEQDVKIKQLYQVIPSLAKNNTFGG